MLASTSELQLLLIMAAMVFISQAAPRIYLKAEESVDTYRTMVYAQTESRINKYNELYGQYYTSAHNQFSEMTPKEFAATYLGGSMSPQGSASRAFVEGPTIKERANLKSETLNSEAVIKATTYKVPLFNNVVPSVFSVDYTQSGNMLVTPVKDQGSCGSCWAFAGIAEIESYYLKKHKLYLDLSEQQMVDCLPAFQSGNAGCGGGYLDSVSYYATVNPVSQNKYYPYLGVDGTCNQARIAQGRVFKIRSYVYIYDCITLSNVILTYKPVGICGSIDEQWMSYSSGVIPNCNAPVVGGHCVLLVGATSDGTSNVNNNYWKIRNSWGTGYGESGFMRVFRDPNDNTTGPCGICQEAIYSL